MAFGLQVFDASGGTVVDITDRLTRFHSDYTLTIPGSSYTDIPITGMDTDGTWVAICTAVSFELDCEVNTGYVRVRNNYAGSLVGYVQVFRL